MLKEGWLAQASRISNGIQLIILLGNLLLLIISIVSVQQTKELTFGRGDVAFQSPPQLEEAPRIKQLLIQVN